MPKMTMRVILKSGVEFSIKCDKFTINRDGYGNVRGYDIGGIVENKPVYWTLNRWRRLSAYSPTKSRKRTTHRKKAPFHGNAYEMPVLRRRKQ